MSTTIVTIHQPAPRPVTTSLTLPTFEVILTSKNLEGHIISSHSNKNIEDEALVLGNLDQNIDNFDFGPILFNTDAKDVPDEVIISGYKYKILNNKLNI